MSMLTVRLDEKTEENLKLIMQHQSISRSAFIKQLINQYQDQETHPTQTPTPKTEGPHSRKRHLLSQTINLSQHDRRHAFTQKSGFDALIDANSIISFYNANDDQHLKIYRYIENFKGQLLTSECCIAEVMWILQADSRVQLELLADLSHGLFRCPNLQDQDYKNMQQMLMKQPYKQSFTDLSLIALSQQKHIQSILCSENDFQRYQNMQPKLERVILV